MRENLISIITPLYNSEKYVDQAITSVLNQTYQNWEMLIVDDKSTDKGPSIVNRYAEKDSRIHLLTLESNMGPAVARNLGLETAQGRFVAFLDSDDLWENEKLEKQLEFMLGNKLGFSFTSYLLINEQGDLKNKGTSVPETINYNQLLKENIIGCSTVMIDRQKIGDFRMPLVRAGQDFGTWLSILKTGHFAYGLNEQLTKYRLVKGSVSSNKFKAVRRTWNIYRNVEKLNLFKSMFVIGCYAVNYSKKRIFA